MLTFSVPVDAIIGVYLVEIEARGESINFPHPLIVLLNPWCKEDTVYMEEEQLLEEYILNDDGYIWVSHITLLPSDTSRWEVPQTMVQELGTLPNSTPNLFLLLSMS